MAAVMRCDPVNTSCGRGIGGNRNEDECGGGEQEGDEGIEGKEGGGGEVEGGAAELVSSWKS
jgi:hypothetical protein